MSDMLGALLSRTDLSPNDQRRLKDPVSFIEPVGWRAASAAFCMHMRRPEDAEITTPPPSPSPSRATGKRECQGSRLFEGMCGTTTSSCRCIIFVLPLLSAMAGRAASISHLRCGGAADL